MQRVVITSRPAEDQFMRVDLLKQAFGEPVLDGDDENWILGEPLEATTDDGETIVVALGFTTDGASIPTIARLVTGWKKFEGPQRWGGIIHDWLYYQPDYGKVRADDVFRLVLREEGASWFRTAAMYWAVRIFGGGAYRSNQSRDVSTRIWGNPDYPREE